MVKIIIFLSAVLILGFILPNNPGPGSDKKVTIRVRDTIKVRDTLDCNDTLATDTASDPNVHLADGLLAYFPFNGNADDESGNGNHGTLFNGAEIGAGQNGDPSGALSLNGNNGVMVNDGGKLNPTDSMTISFDIMIRSVGRQVFVSKVNINTGFGAAYQVCTSVPGDLRFQFGIIKSGTDCNWFHASNDAIGANPGIVPQPGSWYTVVATYQLGVMNLYVNGSPTGAVTYSNNRINYCPGSQFLIGTWWKGDYAGLDGKIDNVRVYGRVLNQDEINTLNLNNVVPVNDSLL